MSVPCPQVSSDAAAAPAPLESLDLWPWLSGAAPASPRTEVVYDHRMNSTDRLWNTTLLPGHAMGALRVGRWKLVVGATKQASWYGRLNVILDCFARLLEHHTTLHALCAVLCFVALLVGCRLVLAI